MIFRANGESSMINAATVTADSPRTSLPAVLLQRNYYSLRKLSMNRAHVGSASARSALRDLANEYRVDVRASGAWNPYFRKPGDRHRTTAYASAPVDYRKDRHPCVAQCVRGPRPGGIGGITRRHASTHALADRADRSARLDGQNIANLDRAGASGPKILPECVSADRAIARTLHR